MHQHLRTWQSWRRLRALLKTAFSPRYLLLTNVTISGGLTGAADISMQKANQLQSRTGAGAPTTSLPPPVTSEKILNRSNISLSSAGTTTTTSDVSRYKEVKPVGVNLHRLLNMTITGVLGGLIAHYWYIWLDSRRFAGSVLSVVLKKTLIDQIVLSPVFIGVFFFTLGYLNGDTTQDIVAEVKEKGLQLFIFDWLVYPPAQFINFMFVPTHLRVLYDCVITYLVDAYYCHMKFDK